MGKTCENHEKQWKETLKTSRIFSNKNIVASATRSTKLIKQVLFHPTKNGMVHGFALREQSKL